MLYLILNHTEVQRFLEPSRFLFPTKSGGLPFAAPFGPKSRPGFGYDIYYVAFSKCMDLEGYDKLLRVELPFDTECSRIFQKAVFKYTLWAGEYRIFYPDIRRPQKPN